jgi:hypothetical protein
MCNLPCEIFILVRLFEQCCNLGTIAWGLEKKLVAFGIRAHTWLAESKRVS